jgi:hypothetical protein
MEAVKIIWVVNFFFFSLILFFVWSKLYVISKKIKKCTAILEETDKVGSEMNKDEKPAVEAKPAPAKPA